MLETAQALIEQASKRLGLSKADIDFLLKPDAKHRFTIKLDDGSEHEAFRVQHKNTLGPYKGGIRFHHDVDLDEVTALAMLMSLKTAGVGLPLGGGKGGVNVDAKELSTTQHEELARKYVQKLYKHIGPDTDIPAPDVNTNAQIIDWMVDEYEKLTGDTSKASFTGKSIENGGSFGREAATGRGGVIALREVLKLLSFDREEIAIAIQGVGNVGSFFGIIAEEEQPQWKLLAATDSSGGLWRDGSLSAKDITDFKEKQGRLIEYELPDTEHISNEQLIEAPVDVLVLAALGDVVTEQNMHSVKASIILELANGPVSEAAHDYLSKKGVIIVPDILANAGGVIASYLEWLQNKNGEQWSEHRVNAELEHYIVPAITQAYEYKQQEEISFKEAAVSLAIQRILKARKK